MNNFAGEFLKGLIDKKKPETFSVAAREEKIIQRKYEGEEEFFPEIMVNKFFDDFFSDTKNAANIEKGDWGILASELISKMKIFLDALKDKKDPDLLNKTLVGFVKKFESLDFIKDKSGAFVDTFKDNVESFLEKYSRENSKN